MLHDTSHETDNFKQNHAFFYISVPHFDLFVLSSEQVTVHRSSADHQSRTRTDSVHWGRRTLHLPGDGTGTVCGVKTAVVRT